MVRAIIDNHSDVQQDARQISGGTKTGRVRVDVWQASKYTARNRESSGRPVGPVPLPSYGLRIQAGHDSPWTRGTLSCSQAPSDT